MWDLVTRDLVPFPSQYCAQKQSFHPWEEQAVRSDALGWGPAPESPAWDLMWPHLTPQPRKRRGPGEPAGGVGVRVQGARVWMSSQ